MEQLKDNLIELLNDCTHPGKETLVMQIVNTKNPNKYIDVVERITQKSIRSQPQPQTQQPQLFRDELLTGFIEPLMMRMLQAQLTSIINEPIINTAAESSEKKSMKYSSITREKTCCICRNDFNEKDDVVFRKCEHMFHEECLFEWESSENPNAKKCPVCRSD